MSKRSVLGLLYILQGLQAAGEDMQAILKDLSLTPEQLDPSALIDLDIEYAIQQQLMPQIRHPAIGLFIGQHYNLAGYGPLLMLLLTSEHLLQALRLGVNYQRITFLFGQLALAQWQDFTVLTYDSLETDPAMHRFRSDIEIAGTFKLLTDIRAALGLNIPIKRVDLPFAAPANPVIVQQYTDFYQAEVYFNQSQGAIYCSTDALQHRILSADALTHQRYVQQCDELLQQFIKPEPLQHVVTMTAQVYDYLAMQTGTIPSIATVAHALGLPERTLRYRLASEQTSFRKIRDKFQLQRACKLLIETTNSIETIAEQLHYNEASAFTHAFMRWTGQSPRQYRRQMALQSFVDWPISQSDDK